MGNFWSSLKEVKPLVMFDGEWGMALEPMQWNRASSRVDLGYTELFRVAVVTSGSLWTCDSVLGDSLEFHQGSQGCFHFDGEDGIALLAMQGNRASACVEGDVSWFFWCCDGNLGYILELRPGWPFKPRVCSASSGLLSSCKEHLRILLKAWQGNRDTSRGEAGDPGSLSTCNRDIGIPINF